MQVGVTFPQTEIGADPGGVRAYAQAVQDIGYRHLLAYDHVLGADPVVHAGWKGVYNTGHLFHEPFVLFGYLAAAAPGLELAPAVIILPQRQTALVAKQAAEVDVLTGGRTRLGVGIGWNAVEYEALGQNFRNRGRRLEEQIDVLRRLLTEPSLTCEGRDHTITGAGINPLPVQRPIPIWIGGSSKQNLQRVARLADGYFPQRPLPEGWDVTFQRIAEWRREAGRDPATLGIEARINVGTGTPDDWKRAADEWRSRGATHLSVNSMGGGLVGPDAHVERVRQAWPALQ